MFTSQIQVEKEGILSWKQGNEFSHCLYFGLTQSFYQGLSIKFEVPKHQNLFLRWYWKAASHFFFNALSPLSIRVSWNFPHHSALLQPALNLPFYSNLVKFQVKSSFTNHEKFWKMKLSYMTGSEGNDEVQLYVFIMTYLDPLKNPAFSPLFKFF